MSQIVKFNKDSSLQRIRASFLDDTISLTPKEIDIKEKCRYVFTLRLKNKYSRSQAIEMLMKEYAQSEDKVSIATAYRIYNKAMFIYGELDNTDTRAERTILRENYYNLYQLALKEKKVELAKKILDSYRELFDFDVETSELEAGKLKPNEYKISVNKVVTKMVRDTLQNGIVDFNAYPAEDVEYTEIQDGEKES